TGVSGVFRDGNVTGRDAEQLQDLAVVGSTVAHVDGQVAVDDGRVDIERQAVVAQARGDRGRARPQCTRNTRRAEGEGTRRNGRADEEVARAGAGAVEQAAQDR